MQSSMQLKVVKPTLSHLNKLKGIVKVSLHFSPDGSGFSSAVVPCGVLSEKTQFVSMQW